MFFRRELGQWGLRNVSRGYFLGSDADKLTCTAKVPGPGELWSVHLCSRPQVTLRSVGRKRYARLTESGDEIAVDSNVPWGSDTLFTLEFRDGQYALHTPNNKYLTRDGKLQVGKIIIMSTISSQCLGFEKPLQGCFLSTGVVRARKFVFT